MGREAWVAHDLIKAWGAHPRLRLWRANTGVGWFANGKPARKGDPGAYPVKFGVPGQGDYSGLVVVSSEPLWGVRLEIETKAPNGVQSDEQILFQNIIERFGGVYVLVREVADMDRAMARLGITR